MAYDKSYNALFSPGGASDLFNQFQDIKFAPELNSYSHSNAWWLAELCHLVYKIDDQRRQPEQSNQEIESFLDRIGWSLRELITDAQTSTCVAVFEVIEQENKALVVVFCGSNEALDWKINFQAGQIATAGFGNVHQGFLTSVYSVSDNVLSAISGHAAPVILAGHSLGAALASLMAVELNQQQIPFSACYSFGSPRIGNEEFSKVLTSLPFYRLVNNCDLVTSLPISLGANEYIHPDNAIFFDQSGGFANGLTDLEIQQRQAAYFPALKRYLDGQQLISRIKSLSTDLPDYFADHAIANYAERVSNHLTL